MSGKPLSGCSDYTLNPVGVAIQQMPINRQNTETTSFNTDEGTKPLAVDLREDRYDLHADLGEAFDRLESEDSFKNRCKVPQRSRPGSRNEHEDGIFYIFREMDGIDSCE